MIQEFTRALKIIISIKSHFEMLFSKYHINLWGNGRLHYFFFFKLWILSAENPLFLNIEFNTEFPKSNKLQQQSEKVFVSARYKGLVIN